MGARNIIQRCRPILIVEIEQRHIKEPISNIFKLIEGMKYNGFFLHSGKINKLKNFKYKKHQFPYLNNVLNKNYINNFIFLPKK